MNDPNQDNWKPDRQSLDTIERMSVPVALIALAIVCGLLLLNKWFHFVG